MIMAAQLEMFRGWFTSGGDKTSGWHYSTSRSSRISFILDMYTWLGLVRSGESYQLHLLFSVTWNNVKALRW